jgi:hypothetical protein
MNIIDTWLIACNEIKQCIQGKHSSDMITLDTQPTTKYLFITVHVKERPNEIISFFIQKTGDNLMWQNKVLISTYYLLLTSRIILRFPVPHALSQPSPTLSTSSTLSHPLTPPPTYSHLLPPCPTCHPLPCTLFHPLPSTPSQSHRSHLPPSPTRPPSLSHSLPPATLSHPLPSTPF